MIEDTISIELDEKVENKIETKEKNKNFLLAACIIIYVVILAISIYTIYYFYKRPNTYILTLVLNIISLILAIVILVGAIVIHIKFGNNVSIFKYIFCILAILILIWNIYYIYKSRNGQYITSTKNTASIVMNSLLIIFSIILIIVSLYFAFQKNKVSKKDLKKTDDYDKVIKEMENSNLYNEKYRLNNFDTYEVVNKNSTPKINTQTNMNKSLNYFPNNTNPAKLSPPKFNSASTSITF